MIITAAQLHAVTRSLSWPSSKPIDTHREESHTANTHAALWSSITSVVCRACANWIDRWKHLLSLLLCSGSAHHNLCIIEEAGPCMCGLLLCSHRTDTIVSLQRSATCYWALLNCWIYMHQFYRRGYYYCNYSSTMYTYHHLRTTRPLPPQPYLAQK